MLFNYDFEKNGSSFVNKPQSREFRNLKIAIERHLQSDYHEKKIKENIERDIEDEKDRIYNEKVGIKLGLIIYKNVKDKASYLQYESDVTMASINGEQVGNINHSEMFAREIVEHLANEITFSLTKYFSTVLECTGELPPISFAPDKMTLKHHTGHMAAAITLDISSPLCDSFN